MSYSADVLALSPRWYPRMGEPSGTTCVDAVGGASGTYSGGFTLAQPGLLTGDADTAVLFNGSTGKVQFADRTAFDMGNSFTLMAWVVFAPGEIGANSCICDKGANAYIWRKHSDDKMLLRRNSVGDLVKSTTTVTHSVPYFLTAGWNGTTALMTQNGVDVTGSVTAQTFTDTSIAFGLAAADAGTTDFFGGTIDEPAGFSGLLSLAQIQAIYASGLATAAGGPRAGSRALLGVGR